MKSVYRNNLSVLKFFCGDSTDTFNFYGQDWKGGRYRNAYCTCAKGSNGKTSCEYQFKGQTFDQDDADGASCNTNQPDNIQLDLDNGDLDLANNQDSLDQNA